MSQFITCAHQIISSYGCKIEPFHKPPFPPSLPFTALVLSEVKVVPACLSAVSICELSEPYCSKRGYFSAPLFDVVHEIAKKKLPPKGSNGGKSCLLPVCQRTKNK